MLDGLGPPPTGGELASAGIDSWGVDYGLLDSGGALLGNPVHYRDAPDRRRRGPGAGEDPGRELYAVTGIQQLPINTICQLVAAAGTPQLQAAATLLLIPDLLGYWLTGSAGAEITNASTTQLLDVRAQAWATSLMDRAGIPPGLFPPLRRPGEVIGELLPDVAAGAGLPAGAAGGRGRLARHRVGRGGRPGAGQELRLHLLRHLVAGRVWSSSQPVLTAGQPPGELQQRDRHRRHGPLPAQRGGPVAAAGVAADLVGG